MADLEKGYTMKGHDVTVGLDVGKSFHHLYAVAKGGEVLFDSKIEQCERSLVEVFSKLRDTGSVLVVVDQPNNIGSLAIASARKAGCEVAYLPGLAMRRAAGILPDNAKTDARDAHVICMTALSIPEALRIIPEENALRDELATLSAIDDDARCDMTREINRLRAHLVECHPAFERALGDNVISPFVLRLLERFGGPWGMRRAGAGAVRRWARAQRRPAVKLLERLLSSLDEMSDAPSDAALREEWGHPGPWMSPPEIRLAPSS
jgi:transposase